MSLTQADFREIKTLIREEVGDGIAKNNLVLFELFEKTFVTKVEFKAELEKFATKEDLAKVQDLVVLINHKLDTEYRFIQRRGEENSQRINKREKEIPDVKSILGITP